MRLAGHYMCLGISPLRVSGAARASMRRTARAYSRTYFFIIFRVARGGGPITVQPCIIPGLTVISPIIL